MDSASAPSRPASSGPPVRAAAALFGAALKRDREAAGLSQARLAERAGLHDTHVSRLERGLRQPTLETLLRLGRALGLAPGAWVGAVDAAWAEEA